MTSLAMKLANAIRRAPTRQYLNYMYSQQWARTRQEHLKRCDYWCELCRRHKATTVHHWTYVRLGREHPQDLCAVCVWCHHKLHAELVPIAANDNAQLSLPLEDAG